MCVRYLLEIGIEELVRNYRAQWIDEKLKDCHTGDFYPRQSATIVVQQRTRTITSGVWGFDYPSKKKVVANARADTLLERPMFRDAARYNRCIVPANWFYEWKSQNTGKKEKYRIGLRGEGIMSLGGLYKLSFEQGSGAKLLFVIITTDAEGDVREVHPRMPLIISRELVDLWLSRDTPVEVVEEILRGKMDVRFMVEKCEDEKDDGQASKGMRGEQIKMF